MRGRPELVVPIISSSSAWIFILILAITHFRALPAPPVVVVEEPVGKGPALFSPAPYVNAATFIGVVAIAGMAFIYIFKRLPRLASLFSSILYFLVSFVTLTFYLLILSSFIPILASPLIFPISLSLTTLITRFIKRSSGLASLTAASVTGSSAGVLIASMIPPFTALVLILAISVFDLLMVRRGYLTVLGDKRYQDRIPLIRGMVVEVGELSLGLGDLVFYALVIAVMFFQYGLLAGVLSNIGIAIGFYLTLRLLERWPAAPGLSIPLILGLAAVGLPLLLSDL